MLVDVKIGKNLAPCHIQIFEEEEDYGTKTGDISYTVTEATRIHLMTRSLYGRRNKKYCTRSISVEKEVAGVYKVDTSQN